jgi:transcriptional regulator with XRE-family HTH domain
VTDNIDQPLTTAERIKLARTEKGWNQKQLAAATGISQGNISRYEKGVVTPGGEIVDRIMAALGASRVLAAEDGALGIQGRAAGKLIVVDPMAKPIPIEWLAEGFVARGFVTMVAGEPGAGKSMLTQTIAEALVAGKDEAAGFPLQHRYAWRECDGFDCGLDERGLNAPHSCSQVDSRVLVLDAENAPNIIQERAQNMGLEPTAAARYIAAASDGFDIYKDRASLDAMLADARDSGAPIDLLVIDSFTSMWLGNENVIEQVSAVLKWLNATAAKYKLGILLIHHTDKDGETYRGSSAIAAVIGGGVFTFTRFDEKEGEDFTARRIVCKKLRFAAEPAPSKVYLTGHGIDTEPRHERRSHRAQCRRP